MAHVLIVDDERDLAELLDFNLRTARLHHPRRRRRAERR